MLDIPGWLQAAGFGTVGGGIGLAVRGRLALTVVGLVALRYRSADEVAKVIEATRPKATPTQIPEPRKPDEPDPG